MFNPYGYGPQIPQFNGFSQNMMQQPSQYQNSFQQNNQQAQQPNMPVVMQVSNIKQVEQSPVQPGGKVLILVSNAPVIAMRTADNMGLTTTDYYRIERFDPDVQASSANNDYVTRSEFNQFVESIRANFADQPAQSEKENTKK